MRWGIAATEVACAAFAGVLIAQYDVRSWATWTNPSFLTLVGVNFAWLMFLTAAICKAFSDCVQDNFKEELRQHQEKKRKLEEELLAEQQARRLIRQQRDSCVQMDLFIAQVLQRKKRCLLEFLRENEPSLENLLKACDPTTQIRYILEVMYEFFRGRLDVGKQLRLAIFMKDGKKLGFLIPVYSWDGKSTDCIVVDPNNECLEMDHPKGDQSVVTKLYHDSGRDMVVIPDCEDAPPSTGFQYFSTSQREYLKSMVAFRYVLESERNVVILVLDSNQKGIFKAEDEELMRSFFRGMLLRVEFELIQREMQARTASVQYLVK